jgi:hypothetical protein
MSDNFDPRTSKYRRPRNYFSLPGLIIGLVIGIGGAIFFAWNLSPVEEFDTDPWQLNDQDKANYMVAIMLSYSYDGDLTRAVERLNDLRLPGGDPIQTVADTACRLASSGYIDSSSGLRGIQAMIDFYRLQGRAGCADSFVLPVSPVPTLVNVEVPTSTLPPPATKTPTPEVTLIATSTSSVFTVPTNEPQSSFRLVRLEEYCSQELPGLIEVYVQDSSGDGISGRAVRVRWRDGESTFYTGLKPERGPAYADFQMTTGISYTIDMPGLSNPSDTPISATTCTVETTGEQSIQSYRAVFRPSD